MRGKLKSLADILPGSLGKKANDAVNSIDEVVKIADNKIDEAVKELQDGLNKSLDEGVDFEKKGATKTKNMRQQTDAEPPTQLDPKVSFLDNVGDHIKYKDPSIPRKRGIGGAHNADEFAKAAADEGAQIVKRKPHPSVDGIEIVEYKMPALDKTGKPTSQFQKKIHTKTIYDPKKVSDDQMMQWGREAAENASANGPLPREWTGVTNDDIPIRGCTDGHGNVTSFFID